MKYIIATIGLVLIAPFVLIAGLCMRVSDYIEG